LHPAAQLVGVGGTVCIILSGKRTKGGKMKGKIDILNEKTVCPTYFAILSHIESVVINDSDVLKSVICVSWSL